MPPEGFEHMADEGGCVTMLELLVFFKGGEDTPRRHPPGQSFRRPSLRSASSKTGRAGETNPHQVSLSCFAISQTCPVLLAPRQKITDYEMLCRCVENELLTSLRGYVLCSWYNHWTSIIIEDIFKDHASVLPADGLVKKIDFFVRDVPFDLKVTYLPEGYLSEKRKTAGHRPELTLLKRAARIHGLPIAADLAVAALLQDLWAKVADHPAAECKQLIAELVNFRDALVVAIEHNPQELIRWLYENQGDRRFDASNRLFVVLVDQRNYFDSWKLKRAKALMEAKIRNYLDGCGNNPGQRLEFDWEGERYSTISDVLVVRHSST